MLHADLFWKMNKQITTKITAIQVILTFYNLYKTIVMMIENILIVKVTL